MERLMPERSWKEIASGNVPSDIPMRFAGTLDSSLNEREPAETSNSLAQQRQGAGDILSWPVPLSPAMPKGWQKMDTVPASRTKVDSQDDANSPKPANTGLCPFKTLHRAGLATEFLKHPFYGGCDEQSKTILDGIHNHSSDICMKIQFLVNNLKDCSGIWSQLFLQKLNALVIQGDPAHVKAALAKDWFAVAKNLINYYANESRCVLVFRYWCLFYNIFQKNLLPYLPPLLKAGLMNQLQKDFKLASKSQCRCMIAANGQVCLPEDEEEHKVISCQSRLCIVTVLMHYLLCKVDDFSTIEKCKDTYSIPSIIQFTKDHVIPLYTDLFESSSEQSKNDPDAFLKDTILHLLIALQYVSHENAVFSSALEVLLEMGCLSVAIQMKDKLLKLLSKEIDFLKNEATLIIVEPDIRLQFSSLGVHGVMKSLCSIVTNVEYSILSREELTSLLNESIQLQSYVAKVNAWNETDENIYLQCRQLQSALENKLGLASSPMNSVESDQETIPDDNGLQMKDLQPASLGRQTKHTFEDSSDEFETLQESVPNWTARLRRGYQYELNDIDVYRRNRSILVKWLSATIVFVLGCFRCGDRK